MNPYSQAANVAKELQQSDPETARMLEEIAEQPTGIWLGDWTPNVKKFVADIMNSAETQQTVPLFVTYNVPMRDLGQYSAGGLGSSEQYLAWIREIALGIGDGQAVVILEPDALPQSSALSANQRSDRVASMREAVEILKTESSAIVMLDIGHSNWLSIDEAVKLLQEAGIDQADGFSLNVSNFRTTEELIKFGEAVSSQLDGKPYVIDTSRNGAGPSPDNEWCNPTGVGLGEAPSTTIDYVDAPHLAAQLWVKPPGESDGDCRGNLPAGQFSVQLAKELYENSPYFGKE